MVDGSGLMKRELTADGLHPNDAGYKIMAPLAQSAIDKRMASR
jgi:lysophospholipase L1-like esterase